MAKGIHRLCSGLLALLLLSVSVVPCYAAEGFGGGSPGGGARRGDFFTWTNGFGGGSFGGGVRRDEAAAAYSDYVQTLPATGYTSAGNLLWYPSFSDVSAYKIKPSGSVQSYTELPFSFGALSFSKCDVDSISMSSSTAMAGFIFYYSLCAPYSGVYRCLVSRCCDCTVFYKTGSKKYTVNHKETDALHVAVNQKFDSPNTFVSVDSSDMVSANALWYFPVYEVIPDTAVPAETYNTTTRPTSITGGNYGVVGDNNEITKVEDNSTIINETNNTYYNPATGTTVPITDWTYDYSDRSYKVTMESGDTATITYGDENISITETNSTSGDTVTNNYTVYYLVDAPDQSTCTHEWTETGTTPATCTVPGSKLFTCSLCSQTKNESISALDHDWQVKQTVTTQYDETGQLVQQGYTVFECSRCHEQYKSEDGALPPAVPPGTGTDITTVDALKDKLQIAADALLGIFHKLPELFNGFTEFLSAVFPFVPTEFITIFELGLFLLIAAAALRKFLS